MSSIPETESKSRYSTPVLEAITQIGVTLTCEICSHLLTDPLTLSTCGHSFCSVCLNDDQSANYDYKCFICKIPYPSISQAIKNSQLTTLVNEFILLRGTLCGESINQSADQSNNHSTAQSVPHRRNDEQQTIRIVGPKPRKKKQTNNQSSDQSNKQSTRRTRSRIHDNEENDPINQSTKPSASRSRRRSTRSNSPSNNQTTGQAADASIDPSIIEDSLIDETDGGDESLRSNARRLGIDQSTIQSLIQSNNQFNNQTGDQSTSQSNNQSKLLELINNPLLRTPAFGILVPNAKSFNQTLNHSISPPVDQSLSLSSYQPSYRLRSQSGNRVHNQSDNHSDDRQSMDDFDESNDLSTNHTIDLSINQSINPTLNESDSLYVPSQSVDQSLDQSTIHSRYPTRRRGRKSADSSTITQPVDRPTIPILDPITTEVDCDDDDDMEISSPTNKNKKSVKRPTSQSNHNTSSLFVSSKSKHSNDQSDDHHLKQSPIKPHEQLFFQRKCAANQPNKQTISQPVSHTNTSNVKTSNKQPTIDLSLPDIVDPESQVGHDSTSKSHHSNDQPMEDDLIDLPPLEPSSQSPFKPIVNQLDERRRTRSMMSNSHSLDDQLVDLLVNHDVHQIRNPFFVEPTNNLTQQSNHQHIDINIPADPSPIRPIGQSIQITLSFLRGSEADLLAQQVVELEQLNRSLDPPTCPITHQLGFDENCTHIVTLAGNRDNPPDDESTDQSNLLGTNLTKRTYKYMMGLLHGCWIVRTDWIRDSYNQSIGESIGQPVNDPVDQFSRFNPLLLDESLYEISGEGVYQANEAPRRARLDRINRDKESVRGSQLMSSYCINIVKPLGHRAPASPEFDLLIRCSGATKGWEFDLEKDNVTSFFRSINQSKLSNDPRTNVVLCSREIKRNPSPEFTEFQTICKYPCVTVFWFLDSITCYQVRPIEELQYFLDY